MWVACLEEASTSQSEHSLKKLFAQLVAQCNVGNRSQLWAQFVGSLAEDMARDAKAQGSDS